MLLRATSTPLTGRCSHPSLSLGSSSVRIRPQHNGQHRCVSTKHLSNRNRSFHTSNVVKQPGGLDRSNWKMDIFPDKRAGAQTISPEQEEEMRKIAETEDNLDVLMVDDAKAQIENRSIGEQDKPQNKPHAKDNEGIQQKQVERDNQDLISSAKEAVKGRAEEMVNEGYDKQAPQIDDTVETISEKAKQVIHKVAEVVKSSVGVHPKDEKAKEGDVSRLMDTADIGVTVTNNQTNPKKSKDEATYDAIKRQIDHADMAGVGKKVAETASSSYETVKDAVSHPSDTAKKAAEKVTNGDNVSATVDKIKDTVKGAVDSVGMGGVVEKAKETLNKAGAGEAIGKARDIAYSAAEKAQEMVGTTNINVEGLKDKAKDAVASGYDKAKEVAKDVTTGAYDKAKNIAENVYDKAKETATSGYEKAKDSASSEYEKVKETAKSAKDTIQDSIQDSTKNAEKENVVRKDKESDWTAQKGHRKNKGMNS